MLEIVDFVRSVPLFLPGLALSVILGYLVRRDVARVLQVSELVGWAAVVSLGLIVASTLTPLYGVHIEGGTQTAGCDFSRLGLVSLAEVLAFDDPTLNILLFIPLGLVLGFVSGSVRKVALVGAALCVPILIETAQLLITPMNRACQSADVFDNETGLLIGFAIASILAVLGSLALALLSPSTGAQEPPTE